MMHYRMGSDSAPYLIDAIQGLLADDLDLAEVLGGREMRRYLRNVTHALRSQAVRIGHKEFGELLEHGSRRPLTAHSVPRLRHNLTMRGEVHRLRDSDRNCSYLDPRAAPTDSGAFRAPEVRRILAVVLAKLCQCR